MRYVLLGKSYKVIVINNEDNPTSFYNEALEHIDVPKWLKVMDYEMKFMYFYSTGFL